jgi:hypothetical protein
MIALGIVLPLGVAAFIAGLVIGNTTITLVSSNGVDCGSGFGGGSGTLDVSVQAACAPILSERNIWGVALIILGIALLVSAGLIAMANRSAANILAPLIRRDPPSGSAPPPPIRRDPPSGSAPPPPIRRDPPSGSAPPPPIRRDPPSGSAPQPHW